MKQTELFSADIPSWQGGPSPVSARPSGQERKRVGMARAAAAKNPQLAHAQEVAAQVGRLQGYVTCDDVWRFLEAEGWKGDELGNAAGSIFNSKCWRKTGRFIRSKRPKMQATDLAVWEYTGD